MDDPCDRLVADLRAGHEQAFEDLIEMTQLDLRAFALCALRWRGPGM